MIFITHHQSAEVEEPGKERFDFRTAHVTAQRSAILCGHTTVGIRTRRVHTRLNQAKCFKLQHMLLNSSSSRFGSRPAYKEAAENPPTFPPLRHLLELTAEPLALNIQSQGNELVHPLGPFLAKNGCDPLEINCH
jgi:hypothetical protein